MTGHTLEQLESRVLLSVNATFFAESGILSVTGDDQDNVIAISATADGDILINNGEVAIQGGAPTIFNLTSIQASGFDGNDQITLNEDNHALPQALFLGGAGNDLLIGGAGQDFLLGGSGNDTIRGAGNDDQIFGGSGNDVLLGDRGNDRVEGENGNDLIIVNEGDGSDLLEGGAGNDFVQVNGANGAGDDFSIDPNGQRVRFQRNNLGLFTLDIGTTENLDVNGQGGNDIIVGSVGLLSMIALDLDGGEGNDLLIGGDGIDVLRGGAGNDTLLGNRGNDIVLGEEGSDLLIVNNGDGSDFLEGGAGNDFVQVNGADGAGDDFSIDPNGERVLFKRTNLNLFTLDIGTTENLDVNGQGGSDVIIGSVGLNGLIALDLDGGEGNDLLIGGDGVDILRGGAGNDTILGNRGNDIVLGETGSDLLIWNNGDGSDFMEGGEDLDTVQVNGSNLKGDEIYITPDVGRVYISWTNLDMNTLNVGAETIDVNGQGGGDVIIASTGLANLTSLDLDGGEGNDLLIGGDGADVVRGGAGNDTLLGNRGNDVVLGHDGDDFFVWNNGDGSDFLDGGEGGDSAVVHGHMTDQDVIIVKPNGERVIVEQAAENASVELGDMQSLTLLTHGGDDVVHIADLGVASTVKSVQVELGDGDDELRAANLAVSLIAAGGDGRDFIIGGEADDEIDGGDGNDIILGGAGNDILIGSLGNDSIFGQKGDDSIDGGDGDDLLFGGAGADFINGGLGWDYIVGGLGDDIAINGEFLLTI